MHMESARGLSASAFHVRSLQMPGIPALLLMNDRSVTQHIDQLVRKVIGEIDSVTTCTS